LVLSSGGGISCAPGLAFALGRQGKGNSCGAGLAYLAFEQ